MISITKENLWLPTSDDCKPKQSQIYSVPRLASFKNLGFNCIHQVVKVGPGPYMLVTDLL